MPKDLALIKGQRLIVIETQEGRACADIIAKESDVPLPTPAKGPVGK